MRSFLWIAKARVAPGSHDSAKRDDQWRPERDSKRVGCAESRMNRPPPHVHGKECHEEGPPRVTGSALSSGSYREEARFDVVRRFGSQSQASRLSPARR